MSQENHQHKNKPDDFTRLFFPETTSDLFFSSDQRGDTDNLELQDFLNYLMHGFSVTSNGMLVTLLDKNDEYNDAEDYAKKKTTRMHPFCDKWRGQCGKREMCKTFDRYIVDILLELDRGKPDDELWKIAKKNLDKVDWKNKEVITFVCYAGMREMAYRIRIAGRPFAVLLSGQIPPVLTDENTTHIKNNLCYHLNRDSANDPEENENLSQELLDEMRKEASGPPEEDRLKSLIKFGCQLEKIFDNLYRDKRHYTEDKILTECLAWCKNMKRIDSSLLSQLRNSLKFEKILLLRDMDPAQFRAIAKWGATGNIISNAHIELTGPPTSGIRFYGSGKGIGFDETFDKCLIGDCTHVR